MICLSSNYNYDNCASMKGPYLLYCPHVISSGSRHPPETLPSGFSSLFLAHSVSVLLPQGCGVVPLLSRPPTMFFTPILSLCFFGPSLSLSRFFLLERRRVWVPVLRKNGRVWGVSAYFYMLLYPKMRATDTVLCFDFLCWQDLI